MAVKTPFALSFIAPGAVVIGAVGIAAQVILIRELLVVFQGNELVIGILLANWLLTEALGALLGERMARGKASLGYYFWLLILSAVAIPLVIYAGRGAGIIIGVPQGAAWGFAELLLVSLVLFLPISLPHGALFSLSCRLYPRESSETGVTRIYVLETVGTLLGALLLTLFLLLQVNIMIIAMYLALILLALALLTAPIAMRLPVQCAAAAVLLVGLIAGGWLGTALDKSSLQLRFREEVVFSQSSLHGNLVVTRTAEQTTFFYDGRFLASAPVPDVVLAEEIAHFPLLAHQRPENVLLLSGGLGGIVGEILKHPVKNLDYVELDPLIWQAGKLFIPSWEKLLQEESLRSLTGDGRLLLQRDLGDYDVIILGPQDPTTLYLNRFFSRQFFELVKENLRPGGIFAFSVPGSLVYPGPELLELNRVLNHTVKEVFGQVVLIPGDRNLFLAFNGERAGVTAQAAATRLTERQIQTLAVSPAYLDFRLDERRLAWAAELISPPPVLGQNTDFRPVAVYHMLAYWGAMFSPSIQAVFNAIKQLPVGLLLLLLPVLGALLLHWLVRKNGVPGLALYATGSTGLAGMCAELYLLLTLQIVYGYIYLLLSLLLGLFMAGGALGAVLAHKWLKKGVSPLYLLGRAEKVLLLVLLSLLLMSFLPFKYLGPAWTLVVFMFFSILTGSLVGITFPAAVHLQPEGRKKAGVLYAADLLGGWLGGLVAALFLIPLLGLRETLVVMLLVKAGSWVVVKNYSWQQMKNI
jgi:spermidine synthase